MRFRLLDFLLIALIVVGSFFAWLTGSKRYELSKTFERLSRKTGDLSIADLSLIYVQALPTQEPLHFAWRVYLPPNYNLNVRARSGGMSSFASAGARDFIARVRLRENENGQMEIYTHFAGGASRSGIGDVELCKLLHGRWGKIRVEQLGADQLAALNPSRSAVLLKLTMPDEMIAEARKVLPEHAQKAWVPELFKMEFGPEPTSNTVQGTPPAPGN